MKIVRELPDLDATHQLGQRLGGLLKPGTVIGLIGQLGAGKTQLTRALVEGLGGVDSRVVTSPTFVLIHEYPARLTVYHFDAYRLPSTAAFADLGVEEFFEGEGVCVVEWADRVPECFPADHLRIALEVTGETSRLATLEGFGPRSEQILTHLTPEH